jgi:hypothetical protein
MTISVEYDATEAMERFVKLGREFPSALRDAGKEVEREVLRIFRRTTATWHHKPEFDSEVVSDGADLLVQVWTNDKIYAWVSEGTPAHFILPVRARCLTFQTGYNAKTVPGVLDSRSGGKFGPVVHRAWVEHPGTDARHFKRDIQNWLRHNGPIIVKRHIERVIRS